MSLFGYEICSCWFKKLSWNPWQKVTGNARNSHKLNEWVMNPRFVLIRRWCYVQPESLHAINYGVGCHFAFAFFLPFSPRNANSEIEPLNLWFNLCIFRTFLSTFRGGCPSRKKNKWLHVKWRWETRKGKKGPPSAIFNNDAFYKATLLCSLTIRINFYW